MKYYITLFIAVLSFQTAIAQTPPDGLVGQSFRTWVKQNFYDDKHETLSYSEAREKLYSYIENFNDTIECVYSGYKQRHERGSGTSNPEPINAEHIIPQSRFNEDPPMVSDVHILYPAFDEWNSLRGAHPFEEINDQQTTKWILNTNSTANAPGVDIRDNYTEYKNGSWEPRESKKGDIARSVFYFYTVYPQYTMQGYLDVDVLCEWAENDPVDEREMARNETAFLFQKNYNPYQLHNDWANQAWGCDVEVPVVNSVLINENNIQLYPNPVSTQLNVQIADWKDYPLTVEIFQLTGQLVYSFEMRTNQTNVDVSEFPKANYVLSLKNAEGQLVGNKRLIVQ